jgi:hypothetical protein
MGLIGGPFALWMLFRAFRSPTRLPERGFWLAFIPVVILLGIAVVGERDLMGLAHLTLMPLEALGITLIAARFPWTQTATLFLLAGCTIDFSLGIFLQERVQNLYNTPDRTIYSGLTIENNRVVTGAQGADTLGGAAWINWFWKGRDELHRQWIAELGTMPQTPSVRRFADEMRAEIGRNSRNFGGWYGRHDGRIMFLGDHLAGPSLAGIDAPSLLFLMLFLALMRAFGTESFRFARAALPEPAPAQPQTGRKKAGERRR